MRFTRSSIVPHRRGTALAMAVVLSVVITGLVMALAWTAGTQAQGVTQQRNRDRAIFIAEAGAQRMAWYCKNSKLSQVTGQALSGTLSGGTYATSYTTVSGNTIRVTSTGTYNGASYTLYVNIAATNNMPGFASVGDFDNKNITVTGNVAVGGKYKNGGNGSLQGNLTYGDSATDTGAVTGSVSQGTFNPIDFTAMGTTLMTTVGATPGLSGSGKTYNFNTIITTNKVIYVIGNVTDPVFSGSGTLYVDGDVKFTNTNAVVGSSTNPVNIVSKGKITFEKKSTVYGSLYAQDDIDRAQIDITGIVYTAKIFKSNSGMCTMTAPADGLPWFDPRSASGDWTVTTTFSSYTGPGI